MTKMPDVCDYEGSQYRTDFWEGQGRNYEDQVERAILQKLLPKQGKRLLEIGAAYGRLTPEYSGFETVVLLDYSFSQLQYARKQLGDDGYIYVAANAYHLPFQPGTFDGATIIRVLHHMEDAPAVLAQVRRIMTTGGTFILEYANKRNLKALLRYALKRQSWNPNTLEPVEFVRLNFDFHPQYIKQALTDSQFDLRDEIPVSFLRIGLLKNNLPASTLVKIDQLLQKSNWLVSPSVFTKNQAIGDSVNNLHIGQDNPDELFWCPESQTRLHRDGNTLISETGIRWMLRDGIYDFKEPVS